MRRIRSRRDFSLLEILITFALLSLAVGIGAFSIQGLFKKQNTLNDMQRFLNQLKNAQELMALCGVDGEIRVSKEKDQLIAQWTPSTPISELTRKLIKEQKESYSTIDEIAFNGQNRFTLGFYSKGLFISEGVLKLTGNGYVRFIVLPGYPAPLKITEVAQEPGLTLEQQDEIKDRTYNVLQDTR